MIAFSVTGDQLRTASDAEHVLLASRCRVLGLAAPLPGNAVVDDTAAARAMADRRVRAPVIQIVAGIVSIELSHSQALPFLGFGYGSRFEDCASASRRPSRTSSQKCARACCVRPSPRGRSLFGIKPASRSRILAPRCQSLRQRSLRDSRSFSMVDHPSWRAGLAWTRRLRRARRALGEARTLSSGESLSSRVRAVDVSTMEPLFSRFPAALTPSSRLGASLPDSCSPRLSMPR